MSPKLGFILAPNHSFQVGKLVLDREGHICIKHLVKVVPAVIGFVLLLLQDVIVYGYFRGFWGWTRVGAVRGGRGVIRFLHGLVAIGRCAAHGLGSLRRRGAHRLIVTGRRATIAAAAAIILVFWLRLRGQLFLRRSFQVMAVTRPRST
jgi:hypothetical protein